MRMVKKNARGFTIPSKEYTNPVMEKFQNKLQWLDAYLTQSSPISVKQMISMIAFRYGNSADTSRKTLFLVVNGHDFHTHDGMVHKGSKENCKQLVKK